MSTPAGPARGGMGLGAWLAIAFSLLSILLTALLVGVIEGMAATKVRDTIGANLAELAHQGAQRLDRGIYERFREAELTAKRLAPASGPEALRADLDALRQSYRYYAWIGVTDTQGRVVAASGGLLEGVDVSKRPWFAGGLRGPYVGDVHDAVLLAKLLGHAGGEPLRFFDLAFPLKDAQGGVRGVLGFQVSWEWAQNLRRGVFLAGGEGQSIEPLIVAADGTVLLGPADAEGRVLATASAAAAPTARGHAIEVWPDGQRYLVGYSLTRGFDRAPGLGWRVLVRQPAAEAFAPVRELQARVLYWGIALAAAFSLLGWIVARAITRPLRELSVAARGIEAGGTFRAPAAPGYAEVRALGASLESLLGNLRAQQARLRELNAGLEQRVAEAQRAFEAVRASERRLRTIVEAAQDAFIATDLQGRVTDWNARAEVCFGWPREDILGQPLAQALLPVAFHPVFERELERFRETGQLPQADRPLEWNLLRRDGSPVPCEVRITLVDTGTDRFFAAFVHDISERREVDRLKNEFVSTVSHELRTPLTSIYGSLDLLHSGMAGELPDDVRQLVGISHESTQRLIRLINDMLDVEKIASGRMEYRFAPRPLRALVEQAVRDVQGFADASNVRVHLAGGDDAVVEVDADRVVQVCVNLLSNAIKFSPPGGEVTVSVTRAGDRVRISVLDRGPGIPPEFRRRVFERFAQADASDRRAKGGTGLGLSISRAIVEAHGGEIGFTSEPGVRTEFHFTLRCVDAD